jgi:hypothetical protein
MVASAPRVSLLMDLLRPPRVVVRTLLPESSAKLMSEVSPEDDEDPERCFLLSFLSRLRRRRSSSSSSMRAVAVVACSRRRDADCFRAARRRASSRRSCWRARSSAISALRVRYALRASLKAEKRFFDYLSCQQPLSSSKREKSQHASSEVGGVG